MNDSRMLVRSVLWGNWWRWDAEGELGEGFWEYKHTYSIAWIRRRDHKPRILLRAAVFLVVSSPFTSFRWYGMNGV